ncbi:MAG: IS30 family transposase [Lachnospiraceae bacterium]|nr:IS30 family transposase [Lachnospiraceae bacterium]
MAKNEHLNLEDRCTIATMLKNRESFRSIGTAIGKDPTTISKEVRNHLVFSQTGCLGHAYNNCIHRRGCKEAWICEDCKHTRLASRCWACGQCNTFCDKYVPDACAKLLKPPYVCNGCPDKHHSCTLEKRLYVAKTAQDEYKSVLSECRTGLSLSEEEVSHLDSVVSPLIFQGQSLHHICANNKDSVMISESTAYRLVDSGLITARNIDLPRKVRFSRRKKKSIFKVDRSCRIGRTYEDFLAFKAANPDLPITEMDSVEGKKGGKVLLTIHFVKAECMLAFLRDTNDSQSVLNVFDKLYLELGPDVFIKLMPVLLGDNGSEFSNPTKIEMDRQGNQRTHVFYCDPSAPYQKGSAERNHEFIRCFIPKGKSMDGYTQAHIRHMMNHINSYGRPELGDKCPYEMMEFLYGDKILGLLGCTRIDPNLVTLNNSVFKEV